MFSVLARHINIHSLLRLQNTKKANLRLPFNGIYTINLPDAVTLGGLSAAEGASSVGILSQWAVGLTTVV